MRLRYVLFLLNLLLLTFPSRAEYFRHIGLSDGLAQPSVMAIYQDRLGRMWFGTKEGISQYDGNGVKVFKGWVKVAENEESPIWLGNEVSFIAGDSAGDIYFLIDKDLLRYDMQLEKFVRLSKGNSVSALASCEGEVWYMKHDSLFCLKAGGQPEFASKTGITSRVCCLTMVENEIAVGTADGVFLIDRASRLQKHLLPGIEIYRLFRSSQKEWWIGTRMQGLYRMKEGEEPEKVPYLPGSAEGIGSEQIRDFVEDNSGNIWFGTFDGLQRYSADSRQYSLIQIPQYAGGLHHLSIFGLYKDVAGTIWVGSYFGGVNYFNPQYDSFVHYDYGQTIHSYYSYIGEMVLDKENRLWFGTDGGGVCCVDKKWNLLRQLTAGGFNSIPHNNVKSICYDERNNHLYIGTYLGGLSRYDITTGRFHNYWTKGMQADDVPNNIVYHVKMWKDRVYVSAHNGFFCLDTRTQRFSKLSVPFAFYEHFDIDAEGNLYLAGWNNVICTHVDRPGSVVRLPLAGGGHRVTPTRVLATAAGVYIGTLGEGLYFYDRQTRGLTHYTAGKSRLPGNFCYHLCEMQSGKILITGDGGVTCFTPFEETFTTIDLMSNFPSAHIINGCGVLASEEGNVYVGDTRGVTVFSEKEFNKIGTFNGDVHFYFSELWVNNKAIAPEDGTGILAQSLPYTDRIDLAYDQNNLIIHFALSDYGQQLSEKWFRYKLDGLDKAWVNTKQTKLYYTNLDPGTYTLRVSSVNEMKDGTFKEIALQIVVASPWYATWWAWLLYAVAFLSCIFYYLYTKIAKRTLALSLEKERFEKQQIEQLNKEKLVFFTNVSHEFRTPLTLIIGHIDLLLQHYSLAPSIYNQISKIKKNAQKMNNLISELLEFRKLDQNYGVLEMKRQDMVAFLKEIYLSFADYAQERHINYELKLPDGPVLCWFEPQLLEKVFFNLLSNAFKYTSDQGSITLTAELCGDEMKITITDTGIGISEQDKTKIFARFFQGSNRETGSIYNGIGIGLALTKTIVEKHHGEITVESAVGKGSTFTVRLPWKEEAFLADANIRLCTETKEAGIIPNSMPVLEEVEETVEPASIDDIGDKQHTLLLVEDNDELLGVLQELFSPFYKVFCAHNGKEGLDMAHRYNPDLIVSDVMMPEMTGTEMCQQIKNSLELCHIPVILLTALNSTEQNIEGLNRGADDYITKPFHAKLLLARANNLIRNRLQIQRQFGKKPMSEIDLTGINPLDKDFLKRVTEAIEEQIDNTEFDVPMLCKSLGIGRTQFYNKFKALTGMTPNNFILNHRLKYAAELLKSAPNLSVAEISDRSGFNTPVYFSRCFKTLYGCTPATYRKEGEGGDSD